MSLINFSALKKLVMKAGVVEALMLGLRAYPSENGKFTIECFEITRILARDNAPFRDSLVAVGACEAITTAFRAHVKRAGTTEADVATTTFGCHAILVLAHQAGPAVMNRLLTADAAGVLLEALLTYGYHKETVEASSEAILAISSHDGHRKALLEKGVVDLLQSARKSFPSLEVVRRALAELSKR